MMLKINKNASNIPNGFFISLERTEEIFQKIQATAKGTAHILEHMEKILDGLTHEEQLFAMYSLGRAIEGTPTPEKAAKIEHIAKLLSEITNTTITIEMDCKTRLDNTNPILQ